MNDYENLNNSINKLTSAIDKLSDKIDKAIEEVENKNKFCLAVPTIKTRVRGARVRMR